MTTFLQKTEGVDPSGSCGGSPTSSIAHLGLPPASPRRARVLLESVALRPRDLRA